MERAKTTVVYQSQETNEVALDCLSACLSSLWSSPRRRPWTGVMSEVCVKAEAIESRATQFGSTLGGHN